jgi:DNA-directed RNA polymerase
VTDNQAGHIQTDIERQIEREANAVQDGAIRYFRTHDKELATDTKPIMDLVRKCLEGLMAAILLEQCLLAAPNKAKLPSYAIALLSLPAETLALIALCVLFNAIARFEFEEAVAAPVTATAFEIGECCERERQRDRVRGTAVDVSAALRTRNQNRNAGKRAAALALKADDAEDWVKNHRSYHLGHKLIMLAVSKAELAGQPVFDMQDVRESEGRSTKTTARIELTDAANTWLAAHPEIMAFLRAPIHEPTIIRPRPWTSLSGGGYHSTAMTLLKRQMGKKAQQMVESADLSIVLSGVNAMQNTPYRINKVIEDLARKAWEAGLLIFGLETHTLQPLPERLPDNADAKEIARRKRERAETYNLNTRIKGRQKMVALRLGLLEGLLKEPQFYYPHQLDHRGRAYAVPQFINPQLDDLGRALLEFAEGKPLTERGAYWLAIHLANCFWKGKKVSFKKRVAWVNEHEAEIIAFAENPLHPHRFWREAKKPWMFLVACLEWKGYREQGPGFVSHLPVSMDGSCNGYQHLSAMGRDPLGGRATNLIPAEPGAAPEDIYQWVADLAGRKIEIDAVRPGPNQEAARQLLGKIDRDMVKPATMTTPYGVTWRRIYKELLDNKTIRQCEDPKLCARYLATVLEECIPEVAVEAGKIMNWLREVAGILADKNRVMVWTAPTGFVVVHENREPKTVRIVTADGTFVLHEYNEKRKLDKSKQIDGIVANLVHSIDAAHMMRTIHRLLDEGIRHFAMVHDSFGVHACDVDVLNRVLRQEFVRIYFEAVLQDFPEELRKANPDIILPDVPPAGALDIRQGLSSPYFFA